MPLSISWADVFARLALTVAAGFLVGLNRSEHGHAAGVRTTILVCLAASLSMIQANLLLGTVGKASDSFVVMDLMRLPLGILSGIGFIGAGVILRRGNMVTGITTAATIWLVTVMGLCFGGGQWGLGLATLAIALGVLTGLKPVERHLRRDRRATLIVVASGNGPSEDELISALRGHGFKTISTQVAFLDQGRDRRHQCTVRWRPEPGDVATPPVVVELAHRPGVREVEWVPQIELGEPKTSVSDG
ncbi:MAG TPA: MgtC/SapB family protein [Opitutaceae bacterium]|jgi:putative Mg2+ transporter-C (MgtC) family protein